MGSGEGGSNDAAQLLTLVKMDTTSYCTVNFTLTDAKCQMIGQSSTSVALTRWDHENMFETEVVRVNECYS